MLSDKTENLRGSLDRLRLNAPCGAGCFLTFGLPGLSWGAIGGLNAPSGAGCFLAGGLRPAAARLADVLMHLVVLGAF